jgi:hypothetical protein
LLLITIFHIYVYACIQIYLCKHICVYTGTTTTVEEEKEEVIYLKDVGNTMDIVEEEKEDVIGLKDVEVYPGKCQLLAWLVSASTYKLPSITLIQISTKV